MKVSIVYVWPISSVRNYDWYLGRFLNSYGTNPAGHPHESVVVLNGGKSNSFLSCMFSVMQNLRFVERGNEGWDIGAFQHVAEDTDADLMLFFGTTAWIKGPGWLRRVVDSVEKRGDTIYGAMGNTGMMPFVYPHIRTTGFWLNPRWLRTHPLKVTDPGQRYAFEHGSNNITRFVADSGRVPFGVSWKQEYPLSESNSIPNGYHNGNQSNMLFGDRNSDPPYHPIP